MCRTLFHASDCLTSHWCTYERTSDKWQPHVSVRWGLESPFATRCCRLFLTSDLAVSYGPCIYSCSLGGGTSWKSSWNSSTVLLASSLQAALVECREELLHQWSPWVASFFVCGTAEAVFSKFTEIVQLALDGLSFRLATLTNCTVRWKGSVPLNVLLLLQTKMS